MADDDQTQLTAYGYPGDATPDTNSMNAIGDRDNHLQATPDHQSVALTVAERERRFGTGGSSTGASFVYQGKTYYDDDTAPEGDYRIDVYNPNHPPDKLSLASGYKQTPSPAIQSSLLNYYNQDVESEPAPIEQTDSYSEPKEPDHPQVGKADQSILAPRNLIPKIKAQYPAYADVPDQKLWDAFKAKNPTGLSQLRAVFPQYAKVEDNKFLKAVKDKYFKDDSEDEFIDRINPPSGVEGIYHQIAEQAPRIVSGWFQGMSELGKFPERAQNALNQAVIALGINQKPVLTKDQEFVQKRLEALGYKESGQLTPVAKGLLQGIINPQTAQQLTSWAQKQAVAGQKQAEHIPKPHGMVGQVAAKGFEGLGGAPAIAPAFIGGEALGAMVVGMAYDAIQGEGKAREKGLDNSLMFGAEGMGYRAVQQWLMYTPRGRALSALLWAAGGMADQEAQAFIGDPQGTLKKAFTEPVNTAADLVSTGAVNAIIGGLVSMGPKKISAAARDAFSEAATARENGDYKTAAQLLDKTMLLLPEPQRKAATNNLLAWRNEAIEARPGDTPLEMPGQRGFLVLKGRISEEPFLESKGVEMRTQEPPDTTIYQYDSPSVEPEVKTPVQSGEPETSPWFKKDRWGRNQGYKDGPDGVTDQFYYSGIDIGKAYEDLAKMLKPVRELFVPEHETPVREAAGAVIGEQIGKMQRSNQQMEQSWYRKQRLDDTMKFAYEADQRRAFWAGIPKGTAMKMFEQHESGLSTGNPVADRMFALHDGLMRGLARLDQMRGFTYDLRDSYIYHALEKPGDIDRLAAEIRRRGWGDPDFMHAREIPTVEMLHALGFKLKTYNLEELDQMRLEASNRAEMRASSLEGLHASQLALSRFDMAKLEKESPAMAKEIREQVGSQVWRSPRARGKDDPHQTYWIHKDADFMLHRATDPVLWHPVAGAVVQGANAIKQRTVGLNLAWSLYHQVHMLSIGSSDSLALAFSKSLARTANLSDWATALSDVFSLGVSHQIRSIRYNQKLLNWYLAKDASSLHDLSPYEQKMFELQEGGGFVPLVSHERQIMVARMLAANWVKARLPGAALKGVDKSLDFGYSVLSARPYQRWLFGRVIPSLKMYSYDRAALALLDAHPEFNRPQYRLQRNIELRKIRDQVDARYSEQNLRQSFADPHIKYFGQAIMLSYGWLKSFIDVYGGGIHDLTRFAKDRPETPQATNRIVYMMTLTGITTATNMLIAHFIGAGVQSLQDLFYPNIGYDKDGKKLVRVKPPFWITTEFGGAAHDIEQTGGNPITGMGLFFANKMQPAISTIVDIARNKDYYGTDISPQWDNKKDFWDNFNQWIWPKAEFTLKQGTSFTLQSWLKPGSEPRDVLLQMLGVPRAPAYAERTAMENRIIDYYVKHKIPPEKTIAAQQQMDARRDLRGAIQSRDVPAQNVARAKMKSLGMSDRSIHETEKTANETEAERLFSHMSADEQRTYWQDMSQEEQHEFRPFLHKQLKAELNVR